MTHRWHPVTLNESPGGNRTATEGSAAKGDGEPHAPTMEELIDGRLTRFPIDLI